MDLIPKVFLFSSFTAPMSKFSLMTTIVQTGSDIPVIRRHTLCPPDIGGGPCHESCSISARHVDACFLQQFGTKNAMCGSPRASAPAFRLEDASRTLASRGRARHALSVQGPGKGRRCHSGRRSHRRQGEVGVRKTRRALCRGDLSQRSWSSFFTLTEVPGFTRKAIGDLENPPRPGMLRDCRRIRLLHGSHRRGLSSPGFRSRRPNAQGVPGFLLDQHLSGRFKILPVRLPLGPILSPWA